MSKMTDIQKAVADYLQADDNGDGTVTYYDEGMKKCYQCPYADLDRLAELLNADAISAYSLWCSETSHAEADAPAEW